MIENKDKNMITLLSSHELNYHAIITHSWVYNYQVSADMFEARYDKDNSNLYNRYLECLNFITDIPHEKSTFAKADARTYVTDIKYPKINQEYLDYRISSIVTNPNTLVKVRHIGKVYFYDVNQILFITLSF